MRIVYLAISVLVLAIVALEVSEAQNPRRACVDTSCLRNSGTDLCFDVTVGSPCEAQMSTTGDLKAQGHIEVGGVVGAATCITRLGGGTGDADRLYGDKDCDNVKDAGEEFLDNTAGAAGALTVGEKADIEVVDTANDWQINPNTVGSAEITDGQVGVNDIANDAVTLGTKTSGPYVAGAAGAGGLQSFGTEALTLGMGNCPSGYVMKSTGTNTWSCATDDGGNIAEATTSSLSGLTVLPWQGYGVHAALTRALDNMLMEKYDFAPTSYGQRDYYQVEAVYTVAGLAAATLCDSVAEVGTIQVVTDSVDGTCNTGGGGVAFTPCQCAVTSPGDDAAGGATPTYGWITIPNPPAIWRHREDAGANGSVQLTATGQAHSIANRVLFWEDVADKCQQIEYLTGKGPGWAVVGRGSTIEMMLLQLGYIDPTGIRAAWGWTRTPTNTILDPTQVTPTAALRGFTDGWGYMYYDDQVYAFSRRQNGTPFVSSMGAALDLTNAAKRNAWFAGPMRSHLTTATTFEVQGSDNPGLWTARHLAKLGTQFLMSGHVATGTVPYAMNWAIVEDNASGHVPDSSNAETEELRPVVTMCVEDAVYNEMQFHRATMSVALYDS